MKNTLSLAKPQTSNLRPRSKIGRLPPAMRKVINYALREGMTYQEIIGRLHLLGHPDLTHGNISLWVNSGYRQWMEEQTQLQNSLAQSEAALAQLARLREETGATPADLLDTLVATFFQQILQNFDPAAVKAMLAEKPGESFRLIQCLNGHIAARAQQQRAEVERLRCQVEISEKADAVQSRPLPSSAHGVWETEFDKQKMGRPLDNLSRELSEVEAEAAAKAAGTKKDKTE